MNFKLNKTSMLIIFIFGAFLRFYKLIPNLILNGEMGTDYMNIWNMNHGLRTFLIGPRTSHEWFFIPPISYWVYSILLFFGKYNPVIINVFWAIVGVLTIPVCYFYIRKLFDEKVALISSFLLATSPAWIDLTRAARYNAPAGIIFFPYLYFLYKSINNKGKSLFILGLILGFSMSFFPSPFLLIPAAVVCYAIYKVVPKLKYILKFVLGFAIPNITFIIYEFADKFAITRALMDWIPYRIMGFFGFIPKNTVSSSILSQNFKSIYQFFADTFSPNITPASILIFWLITIGSLIFLVKSLKVKNKNMAFILVVVNLLVSYFGLFVHGDPPEHYYLVIFPIPIILAAYLLAKTFSNKFILVSLTLLLGILGIANLIRTDWFNQEKIMADYTQSPPPYSLQVSVVNKIFWDADGSTISIHRIGVNDKFENNFANNYIYLLIICGAKLSPNASISYTIVEGRNTGESASGKEIWNQDGIQIFKSEK